uniref:Retrotransposon gag domain-containing protein n=3 Tax=Noccaea caerulescens TaxID=107243 RepID=A0A1J3EGU1_NOCCA
MDKSMSQIAQTLARMEANQFADKSHGKQTASSSGGVNEVSTPTPIEPGNGQLGYRGMSNILANRNHVLKKIELPQLDGSSPYGWISLAERFFRLGNYTDAERLDLLSVSLQGPALYWFNREMARDPFRDWAEFKRRMIARFSQKMEENPGKRLFSLRQKGSIVDYVNEFEELTTIVTGIDEENLEHMFYIGLKPEMKEVMKMQKPQGLTNCFNAVISMEDSAFCKSMAEATNQIRRAPSFFPMRSASNYNSQRNLGNTHQPVGDKGVNTSVEQPDKSKGYSQNQNGKPPWKNNSGKNYSGMLKLSPAEIAEKRRLGLCYKCPEK